MFDSKPALRQPRAIAFYLPQFYPTPENDRFWGVGFTEWRLVAQARPRFRAHYQPHIPADLGFYDLRLPEVRFQQAEMAKSYGVHGFCWYHYWFHGKRFLNVPFDSVLRSGEPVFPFCLCWANETWSRRWDGGDQSILIQQSYSEADHLDHIRFLSQAFADERYIRVLGRPLFLVYRPSLIPDLKRAVEIWRREADRLGIGQLYLVRVERRVTEIEDPSLSGFDAATTFEPGHQISHRLTASAFLRARYKLSGGRSIPKPRRIKYQQFVDLILDEPSAAYVRFTTIFPGWDNTPRRGGDGLAFVDSSPETYGRWLRASLDRSSLRGAEDLVFINAWNEWSEGAHLEPDLQWGTRFLEETRAALTDAAGAPP
jgi:lipopolysaccharide biosynthesis protein